MRAYTVELDSHVNLGTVVVDIARVNVLRTRSLEVLDAFIAGKSVLIAKKRRAHAVRNLTGAGDAAHVELVTGEVDRRAGFDSQIRESAPVDVARERSALGDAFRVNLKTGQVVCGVRRNHKVQSAGNGRPHVKRRRVCVLVAVELVVYGIVESSHFVGPADHGDEVAHQRPVVIDFAEPNLALARPRPRG